MVATAADEASKADSTPAPRTIGDGCSVSGFERYIVASEVFIAGGGIFPGSTHQVLGAG